MSILHDGGSSLDLSTCSAGASALAPHMSISPCAFSLGTVTIESDYFIADSVVPEHDVVGDEVAGLHGHGAAALRDVERLTYCPCLGLGGHALILLIHGAVSQDSDKSRDDDNSSFLCGLLFCVIPCFFFILFFLDQLPPYIDRSNDEQCKQAVVFRHSCCMHMHYIAKRSGYTRDRYNNNQANFRLDGLTVRLRWSVALMFRQKQGSYHPIMPQSLHRCTHTNMNHQITITGKSRNLPLHAAFDPRQPLILYFFPF